MAKGPFKTIEHNMEHFKMRLKERYDVVITDEEYDLICKDMDNFVALYKTNGHTFIGLMNIKGEKVMVIRKKKTSSASHTKKHTHLVTALPKDLDILMWSLPNYVKNVTKEEFWTDVIREETRCLELAELSKTVTKEEYFKNKPFKQYEDKLYEIAYYMTENKQFNIGKLINYVIKRYKLPSRK